MRQLQDILAELECRRRALRMSCDALAKRSGLSQRTAQRVLTGKADNLHVGSLVALARALGMDIDLVQTQTEHEVRQSQAAAKARRLAAVAQASSALEGQGVLDNDLQGVIRTIEAKLISGPPIRLWSENESRPRTARRNAD